MWQAHAVWKDRDWPLIFAFDGYELDTARVEVRKGANPIHMEPKAFRLLSLLIEQHQRAVSRDEILEVVWDGLIVSEASISSAIKAVRQAIGDSGDAQRRIKTLRGFGFRFIGDVEVLLPAAASIPASASDQLPQSQQPSKQPSIVALPFDLIGDPSHYPALSSAIAHDVIQGLSRLRWLRVIARATAFQFGGRPLSDVAEDLDVDYCLSGSVELMLTTLAISVELNDVRRESIIWVDRYEGPIDDIHNLRTRIVEGTIASIETRISQHEARLAQSTPTENLDAWSAFHVGLVNMYRFTQTGNDRAIAMFDRAIALDPNFAKAYAGRSFAHFQNAFNAYQATDKETEIRSAFQSAERSLELDEADHFANFVRGRASWLVGDLEQGLSWVSRSIDLNPNFAQGHYTSGLLGVLSGMDLDFAGASDRSTSLSPLDPMLYGFLGIRALGLLTEENYAEAVAWANSSANAPGALPVMDLVAAIANDLAGDTATAAKWANRAQLRHSGINGDHFFRALPFQSARFRATVNDALSRYGL